MDTDVRDVAARPDQADRFLECPRRTDRSITQSAPSPSVSESSTARADFRSGLTTTSAPNLRAASNRESATSMATMVRGLYNRAVRMAARPIGPAPTMATTSPGRTIPLSTPTS